MPKNPEKVLLSSIESLVFFSDQDTRSRRSEPIPQLTCVGKVCELYQPEAVECKNIGGSGIDVNWKCEADLPNTLRFGKVTVSCEGWSRPGDAHVLRGSCGLEYSLVRVPNAFTGTSSREPRRPLSYYNKLFTPSDPTTMIFYAIWFAMLFFFAYKIFNSCLSAHREANGPRGGGGPGGGDRGPRGTGGSGWFGSGGSTGTSGDDRPPPPYYAKDPSSSASTAPTQGGGWAPGFWTGLGLGGVAASLWNANAARTDAQRAERLRQQQYDWERLRTAPEASSSWFGASQPGPSAPRRRFQATESEGAGPSNLGETRRSTAIGSSRVR